MQGFNINLTYCEDYSSIKQRYYAYWLGQMLILIYLGVNIRLLSLRIWGRTDHWGYKLLRNDLSEKKHLDTRAFV